MPMIYWGIPTSRPLGRAGVEGLRQARYIPVLGHDLLAGRRIPASAITA